MMQSSEQGAPTMLTIGELERESGTSRSTIYFYVRDGLLPPAQKTAASRAIYSRTHVDLLREIAELKEQGCTLEEIRRRVGPRVEAAKAGEEDLVARQAEYTREAILEVATRHFAARGYKRTRIADIIAEVGITPPVLYSHFSSKRQLFAECFGVFTRWNRGLVEPAVEQESDPTVREMLRVNAFFTVRALSPDYFSLARSEALHEGGDMGEGVHDFYEAILEGPVRDLAALRASAGTPPPLTEELLMYALVGALESMVMRASFDDEYSRLAILRAHLFIYLCVRAGFTGALDLTEELERYDGLLRELASTGPRPFPEVADES
jgi:AcrR family transcriptional regulator/predicted DNA-binding transcriptional regulator AlpA